MVLPRVPGTQRPMSELPDFSQMQGLRRLGPGRYTILSLRQRLLEERHGCFYTAEPDSGSESDSHDPTRECFHIDGAVETTDKTQDAWERRSGRPASTGRHCAATRAQNKT